MGSPKGLLSKSHRMHLFSKASHQWIFPPETLSLNAYLLLPQTDIRPHSRHSCSRWKYVLIHDAKFPVYRNRLAKVKSPFNTFLQLYTKTKKCYCQILILPNFGKYSPKKWVDSLKNVFFFLCFSWKKVTKIETLRTQVKKTHEMNCKGLKRHL